MADVVQFRVYGTVQSAISYELIIPLLITSSVKSYAA